MTVGSSLLMYVGGPRAGELFAVHDDTLIDTFALPLSQCNGSQEWVAYFRRDDQMVFGGRAFTMELAREQARNAMECRPKARKKLRGGVD